MHLTNYPQGLFVIRVLFKLEFKLLFETLTIFILIHHVYVNVYFYFLCRFFFLIGNGSSHILAIWKGFKKKKKHFAFWFFLNWILGFRSAYCFQQPQEQCQNQGYSFVTSVHRFFVYILLGYISFPDRSNAWGTPLLVKCFACFTSTEKKNSYNCGRWF